MRCISGKARIPSPGELLSQFRIPSFLIKIIAKDLNISYSMLYQMLSGTRNPSREMKDKFASIIGFREEQWDIDNMQYNLYTCWYNWVILGKRDLTIKYPPNHPNPIQDKIRECHGLDNDTITTTPENAGSRAREDKDVC